MSDSHDFYISVDVETSGPNPMDYSLLSIGACTIDDPVRTFYVELIPVVPNFTEEALEVSRLSLETLKETGVSPEAAMKRFDRWLEDVIPEAVTPIFAAFNAPFDWMFVNDYFQHYLGYNPFGHKALDIKALYMGVRKTGWAGTSYNEICNSMGIPASLTHHALEDALQQAQLLELLINELKEI
jgi:DNA polymerase III epsilon subunit-like protein